MNDNDMIRRGDALLELWKHAHGKTILGGQVYRSITLQVADEAIAAIPAVQVTVKPDDLARLFHETYETLAPEYGYETRAETRQFDPASPNGRLMIDVCARIRSALTVTPPPDAVKMAALVEASAIFVKDVRDLIANSEGVSGLHLNGDVADWDSLLPGGAFEPWLKSIAELDATLAKIKGADHE